MDDTTTAVADAPSSPAPSAPSSPEPTVTTDRPSIGDALSVFNEAAKQQGKRPRGKPDAIATPSPTDTATIPPDGTIDPTQTPPASQGPIPFTVHETALKNARTKERQAVEQEFRSTVGDPTIAREAMQWFQSAARDRAGFIRDTIHEALADPDLAPQVRSLLGQTLGSARQPAAAPASPEAPPPDFTDGQGHSFYSATAQQARDEWLINRVKADILGEVQPDLDQVRADRDAQQQERQAAQVKQTFAGYLQEARTEWKGFKEHEKEIKAALLAAPLTSGHPAEERILLEQTYRRIVGPKLSQIQQAEWLADLKTKATASSLNPSATGAPSGIPKNVRAKDGGSFAAALKWAEAQTAGR